MKTITQYFVTPKIKKGQSEESVNEPTKLENVQSRKKLKFDTKNSESSVKGSDNLDEVKAVKQQKNKTIQLTKTLATKICFNSNSLHRELETQNYKQNTSKRNCHSESGKNVTLSKNLKRKSNEEVSCHSKKKKPVNEGNYESSIENSKEKQSTKHKTAEDVREIKVNSSLQCKPYRKFSRRTSEDNIENKTQKRNSISKLKKDTLKDEIIDCELNSSLEIFDTKHINKKNGQHVDMAYTTDKIQCTSLFNYFNKVDKETALTPKDYNKIKVEALVHSPPKKESKALNSKKNVENRLSLRNKNNRHKRKDELNASDKIDVLSSELIVVEDEPATPIKKLSGIENYFKVNNVDKAVAFVEERISRTPEYSPKPWTMRVRLTPQDSDAVAVIVDDDSQSGMEGLSVGDHRHRTDAEILGDDGISRMKNLSVGDRIHGADAETFKMFSLFSREGKLAKPVVDDAKTRFLESGVPESVKRRVYSLKSESLLNSPAPFPTISHVQQQETCHVVHGTSVNLFYHQDQPVLPPVMSSFPFSKEICTVSECAVPLRAPLNIKAYLQDLINQEPDIAVSALYKNLRDKKKRFKNSAEVWTEIYKPEMASEIIGNTENVNKLKTWLQAQKKMKQREGSVSSGDEFIDSDSEGEDKPRTNNIAVLSGPYGCGKTCAVYAVANELGCEVLEINSSCNRSGKRLLTEFSESTQSHNVDVSQSMLGLFNPGSTKKPKKKEKLRMAANETNSGKTSLLLVEDADILFANHDEGFVSAIAALTSTSKRPVILTVNDHKCIHLTKFDSVSLLQLVFNKPRISKLVLWLRLVALVEGVELTAEQSQGLVEWCDGDVRRSLLHLQLTIQSKLLQVKQERGLISLWWNWPSKYNMEFKLPTLVVNDDKVDQLEILDEEKTKSDIKSIAKLTDNLTRMDVLSQMYQHRSWSDNPCLKPWQVVGVHATSLSEEETTQECNESLNLELSDWLVATALGQTEDTAVHSRCCTSSEKRWCSLLRKANNLFLPAVSLSQYCCRRSVCAEYLPALRTLGRAEQSRLATYTKRANRYFSYLKGLGIHANKPYKDFMCASFPQHCL